MCFIIAKGERKCKSGRYNFHKKFDCLFVESDRECPFRPGLAGGEGVWYNHKNELCRAEEDTYEAHRPYPF